jgi:hypothetical protein
MSDTVNIELKADPSGAKEALQQVNKSLKEGTEAAEALNHVLDGDLAGTFKSLGELSKTLGIDLGLAFSPAEIIAFAQVVAEVADKLSKLIADTFIYTDAMKEEDKAQRSLNQRWVDSAARIKAIGREMQITAEKTEAGKDALRLKFQLEDIGGTPEEIQAKIKKAQDDIKQATEDAKETVTQEAPGGEGMVTIFTDKAIKADASLKGLNVTLSDLQRELRLANAVAAQGAQVLANDLAAAAEKTAQDKKREQDALAAAADKAAKDKEKEQNALDAWVAHAVHSRGTLTEAVKRMAKEQAQADVDANQGIRWTGATSGNTILQASSVAGAGILTLPATVTDTLVARTTTDTLTNKTLGGTTPLNRLRANQGTPVVTGDWAITGLGLGSWGNTASVVSVSGNDTAGTVLIACSGTGQSANPGFRLTFHDGAFPMAPVGLATRGDGFAPAVPAATFGMSTTVAIFGLNGTCVAGNNCAFYYWVIGN